MTCWRGEGGSQTAGEGLQARLLNMHDDPHKMLMMNNQPHHEDWKWVNVTSPRLTLCFGRCTFEASSFSTSREGGREGSLEFRPPPPKIHSSIRQPCLSSRSELTLKWRKIKTSDRCLLHTEFSRPLCLLVAGRGGFMLCTPATLPK